MRRNAVLDYARLLAAFGIVLFHSGAPGAAFGYAALPFFLMLLVMLMFPRANQMRFADFARSRAKRLLIPWLTWSAVYGVLKLIDALTSGEPLTAEFPPYIWLTGTALHLWFLPFAFFSCLALYPVARMHLGSFGFIGLVAMATLLILALLRLHQDQLLPIPLAQWVFGGPAVILGLVFALAESRGFRLMLPLSTLGAIMATALAMGWREGPLQLGIAGIALAVCMLWSRPETPFSRWAARISLGVYLAHPLVGSLLERLTPLQHKSLSFALCMIFGSVAIAWLLEAISRRQILRPATIKK